MDLRVRRDHNLALMRVNEPGEDLVELVRSRLREMCMHRLDVIYVDLPLLHPATRACGEPLEELGFFFEGVLPELLNGGVLRLQYLNDVEVERSDVSISSEFGEELLSLTFEQREAPG